MCHEKRNLYVNNTHVYDNILLTYSYSEKCFTQHL